MAQSTVIANLVPDCFHPRAKIGAPIDPSEVPATLDAQQTLAVGCAEGDLAPHKTLILGE